ncbi:MAG: 5S rRNA maturation endonuclease (ribonuclease M5) [Candidatus Latescibacterota bacterium]
MPIESFINGLDAVRSDGSGFIARCPAHEDTNPSLSISEGEDGRILVKCHAGCTAEKVVSEMGKSMADLFVNEEQPKTPRSTRSEPSPIAPQVVEHLHHQLTTEHRTYLKEYRKLSDGIIDRYKLGFKEHGHERRLSIPIPDEQGVYRDVRLWLPPKDRTPRSSKMLHWRSGYGESRLYPIDQLSADELILCEGELDALAMSSHGISAITATCGASTWPDSLSPAFSGKEVTILMDHDDAGRRGAEKRALNLLRYGVQVKVATWPKDRDDAWDLTDELREHGLESLQQILSESTTVGAEQRPTPIEGVNALPLQALAAPLRRLVHEGVQSKQCPPDFIAIPLLVIAGAAVGNSHLLRLKSDWKESASLFAAVVAAPGTTKSAALSLAEKPIYLREKSLRQDFEKTKQAYEVELASWRRENKKEPEPQRPKMKRAFIDNATVEAITDVLHSNSRGVALISDELSGWVAAMNAYKGGKGDDRQFFLSAWSSTPRTIDRKHMKEPIFLPRPFLAITGMIQPDILKDLLRQDNKDDGFVDRLLFAYPDAIPPERWSEMEVSSQAVEEVQALLDRLYNLESPDDMPTEVRMDGAAKHLWIQWFEHHQEELKSRPDRLKGVWAKMPTQCARLILITHLSHWAAGEVADLRCIGQSSVAKGTALTEYFKSHARRAHGVLRESDEDKRLRKVTDWIRRHTNRGITARDLYTDGVAGIKTADAAKKVLEELVREGAGHWSKPDREPSGQQRAELFRLYDPAPCTL